MPSQGTHSPDAVKKLLSLSETKVKTVKASVSSTSIPISQLSNSRVLNTSSSNQRIVGFSPTDHLSPKTKPQSISNTQPQKKANQCDSLPTESFGITSAKSNPINFVKTDFKIESIIFLNH